MMLRRIILAMTCLLLASVFVGCSANATSTPEARPSSESSATAARVPSDNSEASWSTYQSRNGGVKVSLPGYFSQDEVARELEEGAIVSPDYLLGFSGIKETTPVLFQVLIYSRQDGSANMTPDEMVKDAVRFYGNHGGQVVETTVMLPAGEAVKVVNTGYWGVSVAYILGTESRPYAMFLQLISDEAQSGSPTPSARPQFPAALVNSFLADCDDVAQSFRLTN